MDLDDTFANMPYIPGGADYPDRWAKDAQDYRNRLSVTGRARLGLMYGHGTRQVLDVFLPDGPHKGLFVFVHGGYWRMFDRESWSHFAEGARSVGWSVVMPSYDLCPRVRIADITRQIAQAVSVAAHDIDGPIRLAGHSAGGHLVSRMLEPGLLPDDVRARIERVVPISPVTDLRPLLHTSMNEDFRLSAEDAAAESPVLMSKPDTPVTVWVGAAERPVFVEQARMLSETWECDMVLDEDRHHFDVIDGLLDAQSPLMSTILQ